MEKTARKIGLFLGIAACAIFIGSTVAGWVKGAEDKKDDSTNQTAVVHVIEA